MINHVFISAVLFAGITAAAQAPAVQWSKSFGSTQYEQLASVTQLNDGSYLGAGNFNMHDHDMPATHGGSDIYLAKLSAAGSLQWIKPYGGSNFEFDPKIKATSDGGAVFIARTSSGDGDISSNKGGMDMWVVKVDATGTLQWQRTIGSSSMDTQGDIEQTSDGGYIVGGFAGASDGDITTTSHGGQDFWVSKLNAAGVIQWQKMYGGSADDMISSLHQTSDGGYILGGSSASDDGDATHNFGGNDCWLVKITSAGVIQWQKNYGGSNNESLVNVIQTADGGYAFSSMTLSSDNQVTGHHGGNDAWIVKTDASGTIQWQRATGSGGGDNTAVLVQTPDGGYVAGCEVDAAGGDVSSLVGTSDYWLFKLNASGNLIWEKTYGGTASDLPSWTILTNDGGFLMGGASFSNDGIVGPGRGNSDAFIVKLNPGGAVGIDEAEAVSRFQLFPNPSTDQVHFSHPGLESGSTYTLKDLSGRIVLKGLLDRDHTTIPLASLGAGVYFLQPQGIAMPALKIVKL